MHAIASMVGSGFTEFELNLDYTESLMPGEVLSKRISAGEYSWRVDCYPRGSEEDGHDEHLSLFLFLVSKAENFNAIFEAFLAGADGAPCAPHARISTVQFTGPSGVHSAGWDHFVKRSDLESLQATATNGVVRLVCGVIVLRDYPVAVPASDITDHFGRLLDRADGSDVCFHVGGEIYHAHQAVLAARAPVLIGELFDGGDNLADANVPVVKLWDDMDPLTFRALLRFIYTDAMPLEGELGGDPVEMFRRLLRAADRYALDRLKLVCVQRLLDNLSADTVAVTLECALMHSCPELKDRCLDFFVQEANFKRAALTEGFVRLGQRFPSILAELRDKAGA